MNVMSVKIEQRLYHIRFEHPWKEMDFRGEKRTIKVTNCAIGEFLGKEEGQLPRYRWKGQGCAKWPIESVEPNSDSPGKHSRLLLKGERLNRDKARRIALARALGDSRFDRTVRTLFWEEYFSHFGIQRSGPPTPPPTPLAARATITFLNNPEILREFPEGGVVSKVVSFRYMAPASRYVH